MHVTNIAGLDLNLLRVLDALLSERNLTRAAKRLGLSQPATSHALARLREHFGDPLFVRTPRGLTPTSRASGLESKLRAAMLALGECVSGVSSFDPRTATNTFTLTTADYGSFFIVPRLLAGLATDASGVNVWVRSLRDDAFSELARGDADVHVGPIAFGALPPGIHARPLHDEHFVCLVREGHPRVGRRLDLDTYASLSHVFVAPRGTPGGIVDEVLAKHGRTRRVAVAVPHFLLAPHLVSQSDMVLTIGRRVAEAFVKLLPLRIVAPPIEIPPFTMHVAWHERSHSDPAEAWFRERIVRAASPLRQRSRSRTRAPREASR